MRFSASDRLFVLTGAGISAESGLATFRGSGGLWNGYRVEQVATPEAWHADPGLVWNFYSMRRQDALLAEPNAAHRALATVEAAMPGRFFLCTQNVDDLHERGGSQRVHHMHGSLFESRCVRCDRPFADTASYLDPANLPRCVDCGAPIRPHIVWFGEIPLDMDGIQAELNCATVLLVVGTSGSVYPAAGLVHLAKRRGIRTIYVGPEPPLNADAFDEVLLGTATAVLPTLLSAERMSNPDHLFCPPRRKIQGMHSKDEEDFEKAATVPVHSHPERPYWKRAHTDWKFWVVVFFLFTAIAIYVLTFDLSMVPGR